MKYSSLVSQIKKKPKFQLLKYGNLYHIHFKNSQELALTFLRIQEFYESPHFKNKKISLWRFFNYYKKFTNQKKFTYLSDWNGFNIPDYVFKNFKKSNKLNLREKMLYSFITDEKFYFIGTSGNKKTKEYKEVFNHEKAHALYYLNKEYRNKVNLVLKNFNDSQLLKYFKKLGYNKSVFKDETQAWLLADFNYLLELKIVKKTDKKFHNRLNKNFQKFK